MGQFATQRFRDEPEASKVRAAKIGQIKLNQHRSERGAREPNKGS